MWFDVSRLSQLWPLLTHYASAEQTGRLRLTVGNTSAGVTKYYAGKRLPHTLMPSQIGAYVADCLTNCITGMR